MDGQNDHWVRFGAWHQNATNFPGTMSISVEICYDRVNSNITGYA